VSDAPEKAADPVAPVLERSNGRWARVRRVLADTEALRYPDYRRLFIGNAVSFVGIQLTGWPYPYRCGRSPTPRPGWACSGWPR
jgi:hypothetical protein